MANPALETSGLRPQEDRKDPSRDSLQRFQDEVRSDRLSPSAVRAERTEPTKPETPAQKQERYIADNFEFKSNDFNAAMHKARNEGKPIVFVFGGDNNKPNNFVDNVMKTGSNTKDAVFMYVDPAKCTDQSVKNWAASMLQNRGNDSFTLVMNAVPDSSGQLRPNWQHGFQGGSSVYAQSFKDEIQKGQEIARQYKPVGTPAESTTDKQPAKSDGEDKSKKKEPEHLDFTPLDSDGEVRLTRSQLGKYQEAKDLFSGKDNKPGFREIRDQLVDKLDELKKLQAAPDRLDTVDKQNQLFREAEQKLQQERELLKNCIDKLKGIPGAKEDVELYQKLLKSSEHALDKPGLALAQTLADKQRQDLDTKEAERAQAKENEECEKAARDFEKSAREADVKRDSESAQKQFSDASKKDAEDVTRWTSTERQTIAGIEGSRSGVEGIQGAKDYVTGAGQPFELLSYNNARAKAREQHDRWSDHSKEESDILEQQRNGAFKELVSQATAEGGASHHKNLLRKFLYDVTTDGGSVMRGGSEYVKRNGGVYNSNGAHWAGEAAEALAKACNPKVDRSFTQEMVPLALMNNNVPEAAKSKLLDGLVELGKPGADGKPGLTREQQIAIVNKALAEDQRKDFNKTGYASSMTTKYSNVEGFKSSDRRDQTQFQERCLRLLGEWKASKESGDTIEAAMRSSNPAIARTAAEVHAKITPTVGELREQVQSDPLLTPEARAAQFHHAYSDPRAHMRAEQLIRAYGGSALRPEDRGYDQMKTVIANQAESERVKLAAASVLAKAQFNEAKDLATQVAAESYLKPNAIPQHRADAEAILKASLPQDGRPTSVKLANGTKVILYKDASGALHKAEQR